MRVINDNIHEEYDVPNELICPTCKGKQDAAIAMSSSKDGGPDDGDYAICAGCGEVLIYVLKENAYSLRNATEYDMNIAIKEGIIDVLLDAQKIIRNGNHGFKVR